MACVKTHNLLLTKAHLTPEGQSLILNIISNLENEHHSSNWEQLDRFYRK
jgi:hypothetical protein